MPDPEPLDGAGGDSLPPTLVEENISLTYLVKNSYLCHFCLIPYLFPLAKNKMGVVFWEVFAKKMVGTYRGMFCLNM